MRARCAEQALKTCEIARLDIEWPKMILFLNYFVPGNWILKCEKYGEEKNIQKRGER